MDGGGEGAEGEGFERRERRGRSGERFGRLSRRGGRRIRSRRMSVGIGWGLRGLHKQSTLLGRGGQGWVRGEVRGPRSENREGGEVRLRGVGGRGGGLRWD